MWDGDFEDVDSPEKLSAAILRLRETLFTAPDDWESGTLEQYLESTAAWLADHAEIGTFRDVPAEHWQTVIRVLVSGSSYE